MSAERAAATRALMRSMREMKSRGRRGNLAPVVEQNRPVILVLQDEAFVDVVKRMHAYPSPVLLAVYYPAEDRLELAEAASAESAGAMPVGRGTTIGMVLDAEDQLAVPDSWEAIRVRQLVR